MDGIGQLVPGGMEDLEPLCLRTRVWDVTNVYYKYNKEVKMKRGLFVTAVMCLVLSGCILSSSPKSASVSLQAWDTLTFAVRVLPGDATIAWYLDGQELDGVTGKGFTYAPLDSDIGEHTLKVTESSSLFGSESRTWSITVLPSAYAIVTDQAQAQQVLYAAYAGIGYRAAASQADDAPLYDALFEDLNFLGVNLVLTTLTSDPEMLNKLTAILLGQTRTFVYSDSASGLATTLTVNPGTINLLTGVMPFAGSLRVDVPAGGYPFNGCIYTGAEGSDDILGSVTGTVDTSDIANALQSLRINTVHLTATETLSASYADVFTVDYHAWEIAYAIDYAVNHPVNMSILPINFTGTEYTLDFRDYTLKGGFALDGQPYTFSDGVRYLQEQWTYSEDDVLVTRTLIGIAGDLSVPGLEGLVTVDSAFDAVDPLDSGTIVRDATGLWNAGALTIAGCDRDIDVAFSAAGEAQFSDPDGDLGSWIVEAWQESLAP